MAFTIICGFPVNHFLEHFSGLPIFYAFAFIRRRQITRVLNRGNFYELFVAIEGNEAQRDRFYTG